MTEHLLTAARMREVEQAAMDSGRVTGLELMEAAGQGVVGAIRAEWPDRFATPGRVVVLCGPGNNGGDGYVIARLMQDLGFTVTVFAYGDPDRLPPDAKVMYERWQEMGDVTASADQDDFSDWWGPVEDAIACFENGHYPLVIDALFGIGLSRPLPEDLASLANHLCSDQRRGTWVAVDVPSGLNADTGRCPGSNPLAVAEFSMNGQTYFNHDIGCFPADLTVTFATRKPGHILADGPAVCGDVKVVRLPHISEFGGREPRIETPQRSSLAKHAFQHKYDHGHALVISGGPGATGASRLAARAALRVGAGLVTLALPGNALLEARAQITALMSLRLDGADPLPGILAETRAKAICIGPALGLDERAAALVAAVARGDVPAVFDADALTLLARHPQPLREHHVLTPHLGEFRRLWPDLAQAMEDGTLSALDAVTKAARRVQAVVLLKGPATVIAGPIGGAAIVDSTGPKAAPWLATAGSGDVLSGLICGLMARGFPAQRAAETGAWLHAETGRHLGPGLIAEDLPEALPAVLRALPAWP